MLEPAFPLSTGEWLSWIAALGTALAGLGRMFMPALMMSIQGLANAPDTRQGLSEMRGSYGGIYAGIGVAAILLAQPLVYMALGLAYIFAVIGRIISFAADKTLNGQAIGATLIEIIAAFCLLAYPLGFIL